MHSDLPVTYVIGHRNPDTDAICSAIAYADLLQRTRMREARAARCGHPTARTEWVVRKAGVKLPDLVMDVRPTVGSVGKKTIATAAAHESFLEVYARMIWGGYRSIPIVEGENQLKGMLYLTDLLKLLLPVGESAERMRTVRTCSANMLRSMGGTVVHQGGDPDEVTDLILMVAASSEETMRERMKQFPPHQLLLLTGDRANVQKLAVEMGARCLIVTGGFQVSDKVLQAAKDKGVTILSTKHDTASTLQFIRGSRRIEEAISHDFIRFEAHDLVESIQARIRSSSQSLFPIVDEKEGELIGVLSHSDLIHFPTPKLVMVDHNEFSQAVTGAEDAQILEVIDHHRLSGNLISKEPIRFINLPVGSTCTIVGRLFWDQGLIPNRSIAMCMCAGIISDTLKLTSPTTTDEDKRILEWLSKIAEINVDAFAEEFFAAGSVLKSQSIADSLNSDRKEYEEAGYKISISQIEELGLNHFWPALPDLQAELKKLVKDRGLDLACLMVTDIGRHYSVLLIEAPEAVLEKVDYPEKEPCVFEMEGVVSRKKQLFPWISRLLASVPKSA